MNYNYQKEIIIDKDHLDEEWLNQPQLALKYGLHWAECDKKVQWLEEQLKIKRADLTDIANSNPDAILGDGVKPTVGNIESFIIREHSYQELLKQVIESKYQLNIAAVAKNEISNSRKMALENLVRLHGQNYFSTPSYPKENQNFSERVKNTTERSINKKIKIKP